MAQSSHRWRRRSLLFNLQGSTAARVVFATRTMCQLFVATRCTSGQHSSIGSRLCKTLGTIVVRHCKPECARKNGSAPSLSKEVNTFLCETCPSEDNIMAVVARGLRNTVDMSCGHVMPSVQSLRRLPNTSPSKASHHGGPTPRTCRTLRPTSRCKEGMAVQSVFLHSHCQLSGPLPYFSAHCFFRVFSVVETEAQCVPCCFLFPFFFLDVTSFTTMSVVGQGAHARVPTLVWTLRTSSLQCAPDGLEDARDLDVVLVLFLFSSSLETIICLFWLLQPLRVFLLWDACC